MAVRVQADQPYTLALRYCSGDDLDDTHDQLMLRLDTRTSYVTPIDCSVVPGAPANSSHEFKPFNLTTPGRSPKRQIMTWPDEPPSENATKFERCLAWWWPASCWRACWYWGWRGGRGVDASAGGPAAKS